MANFSYLEQPLVVKSISLDASTFQFGIGSITIRQDISWEAPNLTITWQFTFLASQNPEQAVGAISFLSVFILEGDVETISETDENVRAPQKLIDELLDISFYASRQYLKSLLADMGIQPAWLPPRDRSAVNRYD